MSFKTFSTAHAAPGPKKPDEKATPAAAKPATQPDKKRAEADTAPKS